MLDPYGSCSPPLFFSPQICAKDSNWIKLLVSVLTALFMGIKIHSHCLYRENQGFQYL